MSENSLFKWITSDSIPKWLKSLVLLLFSISILAWIASSIFMTGTKLIGDEHAYAGVSRAIAGYLTSGNPDFSTLAKQVVGYGWFMPGMAIINSPLYVFGEPPLHIIRIYDSLLVFLLWLWALREVNKNLGGIYALALLIFPTLSFTWQLFGSTSWGDLIAGLLLTIIFSRIYRLSYNSFLLKPLPAGQILQLELILALLVYVRGSTLIIAVAIHIFLAALWILSNQWNFLVQRLLKLAIGALLFITILAPWSILATSVLGSRVVTTSTVSLSLGITFGDRSQLCFGPCPDGNIWYEAAAFSREVAKKQNLSEIYIQREMSKNSMIDLDYKTYIEKVRKNFLSYLANPSSFNNLILKRNFYNIENENIFFTYMNKYNDAIYFIFLFPLFIVNFLPFLKANLSTTLLSLIIKMFTVSLFLQPFVHPSHGRYWPTFAPLMALSAALIFHSLACRIDRRATFLFQTLQPATVPVATFRFLSGIQILYSLAFGSVALAVIFV